MIGLSKYCGPATVVWSIVFLIGWWLAGCAPQLTNPLVSLPSSPTSTVPDADLQLAAYQAADHMLALSAHLLSPDRPIAAASFVDFNQLDRSSPFGRLLSRHIASRMTQRGYSLIEIKMRKDMLVRPEEGELMLSRQLPEIQTDWQVQAFLIGSYTLAKDTLFVSTQIVRAEDRVSMASYDFHLPLGPNTKALLRSSGGEGALKKGLNE